MYLLSLKLHGCRIDLTIWFIVVGPGRMCLLFKHKALNVYSQWNTELIYWHRFHHLSLIPYTTISTLSSIGRYIELRFTIYQSNELYASLMNMKGPCFIFHAAHWPFSVYGWPEVKITCGFTDVGSAPRKSISSLGLHFLFHQMTLQRKNCVLLTDKYVSFFSNAVLSNNRWI